MKKVFSSGLILLIIFILIVFLDFKSCLKPKNPTNWEKQLENMNPDTVVQAIQQLLEKDSLNDEELNLLSSVTKKMLPDANDSSYNQIENLIQVNFDSTQNRDLHNIARNPKLTIWDLKMLFNELGYKMHPLQVKFWRDSIINKYGYNLPDNNTILKKR